MLLTIPNFTIAQAWKTEESYANISSQVSLIGYSLECRLTETNGLHQITYVNEQYCFNAPCVFLVNSLMLMKSEFVLEKDQL